MRPLPHLRLSTGTRTVTFSSCMTRADGSAGNRSDAASTQASSVDARHDHPRRFDVPSSQSLLSERAATRTLWAWAPTAPNPSNAKTNRSEFFISILLSLRDDDMRLAATAAVP